MNKDAKFLLGEAMDHVRNPCPGVAETNKRARGKVGKNGFPRIGKGFFKDKTTLFTSGDDPKFSNNPTSILYSFRSVEISTISKIRVPAF